MSRFARLSYTSNSMLQPYIGCVGDLERNEKGGYDFRMRDSGLIIRTNSAQHGTVLGDIDVPNCRNLGFQTRSGTAYQFDFMDYERVVDGTRMVGNQFMGYEAQAQDEAQVHNIISNAASRAGGVARGNNNEIELF